MLDILHITLIIISIIFFAISACLYREKQYIQYVFSRYKENIAEEQSTSYQIPNLATEEYGIQRVEVETEIPITWEEEQIKEFAKQDLSNAIGEQLYKEGYIVYTVTDCIRKPKKIVKSTFEFAAKK